MVSESCTAAKYRNRRTAYQFGSGHYARQARWPGRRTPEPGRARTELTRNNAPSFPSFEHMPRRGNAATLAGRATGRADDDGAALAVADLWLTSGARQLPGRLRTCRAP